MEAPARVARELGGDEAADELFFGHGELVGSFRIGADGVVATRADDRSHVAHEA